MQINSILIFLSRQKQRRFCSADLFQLAVINQGLRVKFSHMNLAFRAISDPLAADPGLSCGIQGPKDWILMDG